MKQLITFVITGMMLLSFVTELADKRQGNLQVQEEEWRIVTIPTSFPDSAYVPEAVSNIGFYSVAEGLSLTKDNQP